MNIITVTPEFKVVIDEYLDWTFQNLSVFSVTSELQRHCQMTGRMMAGITDGWYHCWHLSSRCLHCFRVHSSPGAASAWWHHRALPQDAGPEVQLRQDDLPQVSRTKIHMDQRCVKSYA